MAATVTSSSWADAVEAEEVSNPNTDSQQYVIQNGMYVPGYDTPYTGQFYGAPNFPQENWPHHRNGFHSRGGGRSGSSYNDHYQSNFPNRQPRPYSQDTKYPISAQLAWDKYKEDLPPRFQKQQLRQTNQYSGYQGDMGSPYIPSQNMVQDLGMGQQQEQIYDISDGYEWCGNNNLPDHSYQMQSSQPEWTEDEQDRHSSRNYHHQQEMRSGPARYNMSEAEDHGPRREERRPNQENLDPTCLDHHEKYEARSSRRGGKRYTERQRNYPGPDCNSNNKPVESCSHMRPDTKYQRNRPENGVRKSADVPDGLFESPRDHRYMNSAPPSSRELTRSGSDSKMNDDNKNLHRPAAHAPTKPGVAVPAKSEAPSNGSLNGRASKEVAGNTPRMEPNDMRHRGDSRDRRNERRNPKPRRRGRSGNRNFHPSSCQGSRQEQRDENLDSGHICQQPTTKQGRDRSQRTPRPAPGPTPKKQQSPVTNTGDDDWTPRKGMRDREMPPSHKDQPHHQQDVRRAAPGSGYPSGRRDRGRGGRASVEHPRLRDGDGAQPNGQCSLSYEQQQKDRSCHQYPKGGDDRKPSSETDRFDAFHRRQQDDQRSTSSRGKQHRGREGKHQKPRRRRAASVGDGAYASDVPPDAAQDCQHKDKAEDQRECSEENGELSPCDSECKDEPRSKSGRQFEEFQQDRNRTNERRDEAFAKRRGERVGRPGGNRPIPNWRGYQKRVQSDLKRRSLQEGRSRNGTNEKSDASKEGKENIPSKEEQDPVSRSRCHQQQKGKRKEFGKGDDESNVAKVGQEAIPASEDWDAECMLTENNGSAKKDAVAAAAKDTSKSSLPSPQDKGKDSMHSSRGGRRKQQQRQHSRVQGSWGGRATSPARHTDHRESMSPMQKQSILPVSAADGASEGNNNSSLPSSASNTLSKTPPSMPKQLEAYVPRYEKTEEGAVEEEKGPQLIMKSGEVVLSLGPTGPSRIIFEPQFLTHDQAEEYFDFLHKNIKWERRNVIIGGKEYRQPRAVAWFGPHPYTYSGLTLEKNMALPPVIQKIRDLVEEYLMEHDHEVELNSVLLNLYENGQDSVDWHSDDETSLGENPVIVSVSLGETRKFEMKRRVQRSSEAKVTSPPVSYENQRFSRNQSAAGVEYFVYLGSGSLLVMTGAMQKDWLHRVPKEYHDKRPRINLTFRTIYGAYGAKA